MAERDRLIKQAGKFLDPDEHVQAIFRVFVMKGILSVFTADFTGSYKQRIVVATDRRYLVLNGRGKKVLRELPRSIRLGQPNRRGGLQTGLLGERMKVRKKDHKEVLAADAAAPTTPPPPT